MSSRPQPPPQPDDRLPLWFRVLAYVSSRLSLATLVVVTLVVGAAVLELLSRFPASPLRNVTALAVIFVGAPVGFIMSKRAFERWLVRKNRELLALHAPDDEMRVERAESASTPVAVSTVVRPRE